MEAILGVGVANNLKKGMKKKVCSSNAHRFEPKPSARYGWKDVLRSSIPTKGVEREQS